MIPVLRWELRQRAVKTACWGWGVSIYVLLVTAVYKSFIHSQGFNLAKNVQKLPDTVKSFTSIGGNFNTPSGFLSSEPYYVVLPILFITLAISMGSSLLASEESSGTIELLLSRPLSRGRLLAAKALSGMVLLALVNALSGVVMTVFTRIFNMDIAVGLLWKAQLMLYLLALLFGALAFMLTAVGRAGRSSALGITMLLAIGGYVLTSLEGAVHWLAWPAKLLPYHYYKPSQILNGSFTTKPALCYVAIIILFGVVSWVAFRRRDLAGN